MPNYQIVPLRLHLSNAYLVLGDRPILVDTGSPGEDDVLTRMLAKAGVAIHDLALILLTHGHSDHAGSAAALQRASQAPVAIHSADAHMLANGRNDELRPTSLEARMIRPWVDRPFPPLQPDRLLTAAQLQAGHDLTAFGVNAQVIATPGHTAGSISLLFPQGEMIVGDLFMGGWMGGAISPHRPNVHYFVDDHTAFRASRQLVLRHRPTELLVGHGGPLDGATVAAKFGANQNDWVGAHP